MHVCNLCIRFSKNSRKYFFPASPSLTVLIKSWQTLRHVLALHFVEESGNCRGSHRYPNAWSMNHQWKGWSQLALGESCLEILENHHLILRFPYLKSSVMFKWEVRTRLTTSGKFSGLMLGHQDQVSSFSSSLLLNRCALTRSMLTATFIPCFNKGLQT